MARASERNFARAANIKFADLLEICGHIGSWSNQMDGATTSPYTLSTDNSR